MESKSDLWTSGSYQQLAPHYLSMAAMLVKQTNVSASDTLVDIGCGTGNVAITAGRRGADVVGVDIAPEMLYRARERTDVLDLDTIEYRTGDAADLPFTDDTFDVTLSCLGHIYADPPDTAGNELVRVTRPDGRIGFTSWIPTSLFPFMSSVLTKYLPAEAVPNFSTPPFSWGDSDLVSDRLADAVSTLEYRSGTVSFPAVSPTHFWETIAVHSGVFVRLLPSVDDDERSALQTEMIETINPYFDDDRNAVELEYLFTRGVV